MPVVSPDKKQPVPYQFVFYVCTILEFLFSEVPLFSFFMRTPGTVGSELNIVLCDIWE